MATQPVSLQKDSMTTANDSHCTAQHTVALLFQLYSVLQFPHVSTPENISYSLSAKAGSKLVNSFSRP